MLVENLTGLISPSFQATGVNSRSAVERSRDVKEKKKTSYIIQFCSSSVGKMISLSLTPSGDLPIHPTPLPPISDSKRIPVSD